jgi:hypothetical protein
MWTEHWQWNLDKLRLKELENINTLKNPGKKSLTSSKISYYNSNHLTLKAFGNYNILSFNYSRLTKRFCEKALTQIDSEP